MSGRFDHLNIETYVSCCLLYQVTAPLRSAALVTWPRVCFDPRSGIPAASTASAGHLAIRTNKSIHTII